MTEVVVTGLGSVLAAGTGAEALANALASATPTLREVDTSAGLHPPGSSRRAALAGDPDLSDWLAPRQARRLSWPSRYAVAASVMALDAAGQDRTRPADGDVAVVVATAFGTARYAEAMIREILLQGPEAASPFYFSESVANAPAAQVAIALGARGANVAVTQREAGPLQAVALAAHEVALGRSRMALAGATEEINPLVHAILGRFRALARPDENGEEVARPFDRDRDGFVAAEGSVMLVLERGDLARARGARPLARIVGWERAFDATAPPHDWGTGADALARRLGRGLARIGVSPAAIGRIVAGASGSRRGDALEAAVLRRVFGGRLPAIVAPKGVTGEYGGGQLGAAVLAAAGSGPWPTAGFRRPDPRLGVAPAPDAAPTAEAPYVLVGDLAAGGAAAWLVLERLG